MVYLNNNCNKFIIALDEVKRKINQAAMLKSVYLYWIDTNAKSNTSIAFRDYLGFDWSDFQTLFSIELSTGGIVTKLCHVSLYLHAFKRTDDVI